MRLREVLIVGWLFLPGWGLEAQAQDLRGNIEPCGAMHVLKERLERQNMSFDEYVSQMKRMAQAKHSATTRHHAREEPVYTIPVVVHLVYSPERTIESNNGALTDCHVHRAMGELNKIFAQSHGLSLPTEFLSVAAGDAGIRFELATRDPAGNPTTGILRHPIEGSFPGVNFSSPDEVRSFNNSLGPWDTRRYMNIFVYPKEMLASPSTLLLGQATHPFFTSATLDARGGDYVGMNSLAFSPLPPHLSANNMSRTLAHEVGHYLDLFHPWGDVTNCDDDDGCPDTPATNRPAFACNANPACKAGSKRAMTENYMDYVPDACYKLFSSCQKGRMRTALTTFRHSLYAESNQALDGDPPALDMAIYRDYDRSRPNSIFFNAETNRFRAPSLFVANQSQATVSNLTIGFSINGVEVSSFSLTQNFAFCDITTINVPSRVQDILAATELHMDRENTLAIWVDAAGDNYSANDTLFFGRILSSVMHVKPRALGRADGSSWAHATTLSAALNASSRGGEIWMARGTYSPGTTRNATYELPSNVVIYGGFAGTETRLSQRNLSLVATTNRTLIDGSLGEESDDTDNIRRLVELGENKVATLDGLAIANAYNDNSGGEGAAIFAGEGTNLTLRNCRLENNVLSNEGTGGAIFSSGTLNIITTIFSNNRNISSSVGQGGAVFAVNGIVRLLNSVFISNTSTGNGGAVYVANASLSMVNTVCRGNSATSGGNGGGVYVSGADTLLVANSIFFNNTAAGDGNHLEIAGPPSSRLYRFRSNIIETITSDGSTLPDISLPTGVQLESPIIAANAAAVFASPDNTSTAYYKINASSVAVDAGTNDYLNGRIDRPFTSGEFICQFDVFGGLRLSGTIIDIGAHEYKPPFRITVLGEEGTSIPAQGGALRLRVEIRPPYTNWVASTTDAFVILSPSGSQMEDGMLVARFDAHEGGGRSGSVLITATGERDFAVNTVRVNQKARGRVLRVTPTGSGDGSSWSQASSLSAALGAAGANDTIWVARGTYQPSTSMPSSSFALRDLINVYGGFAGTESSLSARNEALIHTTNQTILDGEIGTAAATDNINRMFNLTGNNAVINGLTVRNCYNTSAGSGTTPDGGSVFKVSRVRTSLEINNCVLEDNSAINGGVVFASFGARIANVFTTIRFINSVFKDNTARSGVGGALGVAVAPRGFHLIAEGCRFEGNSARVGGALHLDFSNASLLRPELIKVDRCVFLNNRATDGSGGAIQMPPILISTEISTSVFAGNTASGDGGALYLGGTLQALMNRNNRVVNCTFFNNTATSGRGNAAYCSRRDIGGSDNEGWIFADCILWSTATGSVGHNFVTADANVLFLNSIIEGGAGGVRNNNPDPDESRTENIIAATSASDIFESTDPTHANYLHLKAGSPAINTARGEFIVLEELPFSASFVHNQLDAAGNPRYIPGGLDLGAYEYQTSIFPLHITTDPFDINNLLASRGEVIASIDIGANVTRWRASTDNSFLTLMPASGAADGDLTIRYTANTSSKERVGGVQVRAENALGVITSTLDIKLRQGIASIPQTIDLSPSMF